VIRSERGGRHKKYDMTNPRNPHPVLTQYYQRDDERRSFVTALFDGSARYYDRLCGVMSLGSGQWYRRWTLERTGLRPGMTLLDVATGTGLVARAAMRILGDPRAVTGLDPSAGMLREARNTLSSPLVQGQVEELPFRDARFDVLTIGYALRHAADLEVAFRECLRVLKPGGRILVLEISRPASAGRRRLIRFYFMKVLPVIMALTTRNRHATMLSRYYWDTIATCVAPEVIMDSLRRTGFADVSRRVFGGLLSEYTASRPAADEGLSTSQRMAISAGSTPRSP
jgi:demethylmenaquinone methyltransferase/2-methoxy-6-polyprenyl-1,4-benzoquinol methylase